MPTDRPSPLTELADLDLDQLRKELLPAAAVAVMGIPQGVAYAVIAGLPPAMGLYASAIPAIVGALTRSSRLVVVGPTNAVSLVLATSIAVQLEDPVAAAATLALLVGALQIAAGALNLASLVDYLSEAVVAGYVTGAAVLIAVGQLPNVTGTRGADGDVFTRLGSWLAGLGDLNPVALGLGIATVATILWLRRTLPRGVPMLIAMVGSIALSFVLGLDRHVRMVGDLGPVPFGLPPFGLPSLHGAVALFPVAVATAVLSLVESTSVARSQAARTGQRLHLTTDFVGLGAANLSAALFGGYPVSGSLSRSGLALQLGGSTRAVGLFAGGIVLLATVGLGPVLNGAPLPTVAAIVLVVAADLIDATKIRALLYSGSTDRMAFLGTVLGTWLLPLDQAIFVGVGISIVMFLRRARLLAVRELRVEAGHRVQEVAVDAPSTPSARRCTAVRILNVEGPLFFGAASELEQALFAQVDDPEVKVLVVRLKRAQGIDYTTAAVLEHAHAVMAADRRHLMLVGVRDDVLRGLEGAGVAEAFEPDEVYPSQQGWYGAMNDALEHALAMVRAEHPGAHSCVDCPIERHLRPADPNGASRAGDPVVPDVAAANGPETIDR